MDPNDAQMVTLGIGGAALLGLLLPHFPETGPFTWKLIAIAIGTIIAVIMLGCALYDMVAN